MGLDKALFHENVPGDLICGICRQVFDDPVSNVCPHVFCLKCISQRLRHNSSRVCPVCHKRLKAAPASPPKELVDRILTMKINCTSKCGEVFELRELKGHLNSICLNALVDCDYEEKGCKEKMLRKNLPEHLKQCLYRKTTCEACGYKCLVKDLATHQHKKKCLQIKLKQDIISSVRNANKEIKHHCKSLRDARYHLKQEERKERQARRQSRLNSAASYRSATGSLMSSRKNYANGRGNYDDVTSSTSRVTSGYSVRSYASSKPPLLGPRGSISGGSKFLPAGTGDTSVVGVERGAARQMTPRAPHPSRNEDLSPRERLWCLRCDKPFLMKSNHSSACSFHRGPMLELFGGMCESCGRLDIHKGCLTGYHISNEDDYIERQGGVETF
ncbi:E3 ubiquitin-protein ligase TRIM22 [Lingula anatina]|uniref:E3 ubiquitin-protein ligase TRIM22 n=1 Tax=Lingula anatina TaxID=7574 RepID=A0A1S3I4Z6_LINAN|nr:E3 ubiquitin-protein ligase TRIM22 [Lingula anatina]XP_013392437.1 E3 ubiquitin-protein ligase TRIM22 [Lingula anatina]XP_013392439.1 E3 ubiquitin-protein ligase TRIM22 [Lingula anatina]XP_013392440.1 E3 ubiquitin-protein ligase TRIM22 [Lingula anatina]XP_013392441.1 E3 ubiquitin-protein ligase TRIM22 [Lingula anatina]|eukprot:XP_013392436.1 E3 ubiquitin-protein ligase TRIM22 [Lingula anatina]